MAFLYPEMSAAMNNAGYHLEDDVPGIQVEDPSGRELLSFGLAPPYHGLMTGPESYRCEH